MNTRPQQGRRRGVTAFVWAGLALSCLAFCSRGLLAEPNGPAKSRNTTAGKTSGGQVTPMTGISTTSTEGRKAARGPRAAALRKEAAIEDEGGQAAEPQAFPGFQPEQVLTARTTLPVSKYETDDRMRAFSGELLARVEHLPGIRAVGFVNYLPMSRFGAANRFEIEGRPEARIEDQKFAWVSVVGGRYFEAMGIPLLRGRLPGDPIPRRHSPSSSSTRSWPAVTGRARIRSAAASPGAVAATKSARARSSVWLEACTGAVRRRVPKRRRISGFHKIRANN